METAHPAGSVQTRLQRLSRFSAKVSLGGILLMLAMVVFTAFSPETLMRVIGQDAHHIVTPPSQPVLWLAYGVAMIPAAFFVATMWQARRLFLLLGATRPFNPAVPHLLGGLGKLALAIAVSGVICRTAVVLLMTSANPPGQRELTIGLSSNDLAALFVGLFFFVFALVMGEALRIEEDNRSIV